MPTHSQYLQDQHRTVRSEVLVRLVVHGRPDLRVRARNLTRLERHLFGTHGTYRVNARGAPCVGHESEHIACDTQNVRVSASEKAAR